MNKLKPRCKTGQLFGNGWVLSAAKKQSNQREGQVFITICSNLAQALSFAILLHDFLMHTRLNQVETTYHSVHGYISVFSLVSVTVSFAFLDFYCSFSTDLTYANSIFVRGPLPQLHSYEEVLNLDYCTSITSNV